MGIDLGEIREVGGLLWRTRENASALSEVVVGGLDRKSTRLNSSHS
jgi:hypothetical protein